MWSNDSFSGAKGGGFVPTDGRSPAPGDNKQSRVKRSQNVFPMAIKQILESQEDTIKIHDTEVSVITIVGQVKSVDHTSTKVSYVIDDMTGCIEAVTYIGTDDADSKLVTLQERTYGRIVGSLRTTRGAAAGSNNKYMITFKVLPVTDMNEVTSHGLEVLQAPLRLKQLKEGEAQKAGLSMSTAGETSLSHSLMATNINDSAPGRNSIAEGSINGLTAQQSMVFRCLQSFKTPEGAHIQQLFTNLQNKLTEKEVRAAVEFLSGEGHAYSTVDEDHYKCTDW